MPNHHTAMTSPGAQSAAAGRARSAKAIRKPSSRGATRLSQFRNGESAPEVRNESTSVTFANAFAGGAPRR
jgi:hypothetical protein